MIIIGLPLSFLAFDVTMKKEEGEFCDERGNKEKDWITTEEQGEERREERG